MTQTNTSFLTGTLELIVLQLLQHAHAGFNDDVILRSTIRSPHDQADSAGPLTIDQDLSRRDDGGIGHRRIGYRQAGNIEGSRKHRRTADREWDALVCVCRTDRNLCRRAWNLCRSQWTLRTATD